MMFRRRDHVLRDIVFLTLPFAAFLAFVLGAAAVSFYNAEIVNFSGYPTRSLRVGGFDAMLSFSLEPLLEPRRRRFLSEEDLSIPGVAAYDLRVREERLARLDEALPASAFQWQSGDLLTAGEQRRVEVRHRGQRMSNYFWAEKSWKVKTEKDELIDGRRELNLSDAQHRLDNHLSYLVGNAVGLPAPQSRLVRLFLNKVDQGLYLEEEQVDESMIRRTGRMPGDVFFGDLFLPDEPKRGSDDLFCNPFLWQKEESSNQHDEDHRPHLVRLLDLVSDPAPESFDELYRLIDRDEFALFFAVLTFQGDQHIDRSHNHKLYFNPFTGKFEAILWNARLNVRGQGLESIANRMYEKLCSDPRFLDQVHALLEERMLDARLDERELEELDRLREVYGQYALRFEVFDDTLLKLGEAVKARAAALRRMTRAADVNFATEEVAEGRRLRVFARSAASLRLDDVTFAAEPGAVRVFEDRDFDGVVSAADRELDAVVSGNRLRLRDARALLAVGRDFSAPYTVAPEEGGEAFATHRQYTRLAFLESPFLLVGEAVPEVAGLGASRTVGKGRVAVAAGVPPRDVEVRSVHPWTLPEPPPGVEYAFRGEAQLTRDLVVRAEDRLLVEPGTTLRLGPGVSLVAHCRVDLRQVKLERLDPERPWGVLALQGPAASGSTLVDCEVSGGSTDTLEFVDYLGMVSVHSAAGVSVEGGRYSGNLVGDDTLRFAGCEDLRVRRARIDTANGDAIDCDLSTGRIEQVVIEDTVNDGLDLMTSPLEVADVHVSRAGDKGISVGEGAHAKITGGVLESCKIGVAVKDGSDPVITGLEIRGCSVAVVGYDKNWRYPGGGRGRLVGCRFLDNEIDVSLDDRSELVLEDCSTRGRYTLPEGQSHRLRVVDSREQEP